MKLQAKYIDCQLSESRSEGKGRIHSLFHSSVNLLLDNGCFCTLCAPLDDYGPNGIILEKPVCFLDSSLHLSRGQEISIHKGSIKLGAVCIETKNAKKYSCRLPDLSEHLSMQQIYCGRIKALSFRESVLKLQKEANWSDIFQRRAKQFRFAVLSEQNMISEPVRQLIGFGAGSTPSGDDFLTGCLSVLTICMGTDAPLVHNIRRAILDNTDRTTSIGKYMLIQACNGHVMCSLKNWILSLYQGGTMNEASCLQKLLCIGATSGHDMAAGVIEGCQIIWENTKKIQFTKGGVHYGRVTAMPKGQLL